MSTFLTAFKISIFELPKTCHTDLINRGDLFKILLESSLDMRLSLMVQLKLLRAERFDPRFLGFFVLLSNQLPLKILYWT